MNNFFKKIKGLKTNGLFLGGKRNSFNPLSLFADGTNGVFFDPSDKSTMWQDEAGTIPVTAHGQSVARWKSKNSSHYVSQSTVSSRPVYQEVNGKSWLLFDGVDDFFSSTFPSNGETGLTMFSAASRNGYATAQWHFNINTGNPASATLATSTKTGGVNLIGAWGRAGGTGIWLESGSFANSGNFVMSSVVKISGTKRLSCRINGTALAERTDLGADTVFSSGLPYSIGQRTTNTNRHNGKIYGIICIMKELTPSEIVSVEQFLTAKI